MCVFCDSLPKKGRQDPGVISNIWASKKSPALRLADFGSRLSKIKRLFLSGSGERPEIRIFACLCLDIRVSGDKVANSLSLKIWNR